MIVHQYGTLCIMATIGMALYTTTYALMYSATASAIVPVLEMWMISTHVTCSMMSLMFCVVEDKHNDPTSSIFLGVACAVTILGTQASCGLYFGAAAFPRLAAAGAIAWAWLMYVSSFNALPDTAVAALVMAMIPVAMDTKLMLSCSTNKWQLAVLARLGVSMLLYAVSCFFNKRVFVLHPIAMWIMQSRASVTPYLYHITSLGLLMISFAMPKHLKGPRRAGPA
jgi:hypothetical protein